MVHFVCMKFRCIFVEIFEIWGVQLFYRFSSPWKPHHEWKSPKFHGWTQGSNTRPFWLGVAPFLRPSVRPCLRFTAAVAPGNRTSFLVSEQSLNAVKVSWTSPSLLVTEQSLTAAVKQSFSAGDRTILECSREPVLLCWWPNNPGV